MRYPCGLVRRELERLVAVVPVESFHVPLCRLIAADGMKSIWEAADKYGRDAVLPNVPEVNQLREVEGNRAQLELLDGIVRAWANANSDQSAWSTLTDREREAWRQRFEDDARRREELLIAGPAELQGNEAFAHERHAQRSMVLAVSSERQRLKQPRHPRAALHRFVVELAAYLRAAFPETKRQRFAIRTKTLLEVVLVLFDDVEDVTERMIQKWVSSGWAEDIEKTGLIP